MPISEDKSDLFYLCFDADVVREGALGEVELLDGHTKCTEVGLLVERLVR